MEVVFGVLTVFVTVPIAYFLGYKIRPFVPQNKQVSTGLLISFFIYSGLSLFGMVLSRFADIYFAFTIALAAGVPCGIFGPAVKKAVNKKRK